MGINQVDIFDNWLVWLQHIPVWLFLLREIFSHADSRPDDSVVNSGYER
jgi:hypothetical protein